MRNLVDISSLNKEDIFEIFHIADKIHEGEFKGFLNGKSIVLFFPNTSIRTRVTFEKGIYLLGGQPILFPTETLDKKEKLEDVCGYLYSRAINFAAMTLESFARESGCLASFSDRQYK